MGLNFSIERLAGRFGVEVKEIDVPTLSDEELKHLLLNLYEHRVVVLRTRGLTKAAFVAFARRVGDPILLSKNGEDFPEIARITNIDLDTAKEKRGPAHWHTDQSFKQEVSSVTMLYSVQAPNRGGETLFCDMVAAYHALPESVQTRIEDLIVEHRHGVSVAARPNDHTPVPPKGWDQSTTVYHPLVRRHPVTGEKTLYAIAGTSQGIKGMAQAEAETLLKELGDHAFQDRFIIQYKHSVHDLVLWDNPTTMHSATPIAAATGPHDTRLIRRISVRGMPAVFSSR
ncbi:TauD/TfdA family dioxygenase [Chloroflexi bacterium TSY]|nr:TauD/TfdA family dioxygenase [Chloroflexi bacterium TSY]